MTNTTNTTNTTNNAISSNTVDGVFSAVYTNGSTKYYIDGKEVSINCYLTQLDDKKKYLAYKMESQVPASDDEYLYNSFDEWFKVHATHLFLVENWTKEEIMKFIEIAFKSGRKLKRFK
jgi:hypothetical protein